MGWLTGLIDPWTNEAVAFEVEDGKILRRWTAADGEQPNGEDLGGKFILPGFIDSHCHILPMGLDFQKLHLGGRKTREDVLDAVRDRHQSLPEGEWLHAVHYDQTQFPDGGHLHRNALDAISSDRPILLRHVNGHASIANSAALAAAGITEDTPDPKGGTYVRDGDGVLTGVLLERAHEFVTSAAPEPTLDQMVDAILLAGERMAQLGITAATDMMTGRWDLDRELQAYRMASERGCAVRSRLYVQWATRLGPRGMADARWNELTQAMNPDRCAVRGLKIFADGAIGSATAALNEPYVAGGLGTLIYDPERLTEMVRIGHEAGYAIAIHTIGDRSTDLVMDAYEALDDPTRHRIEHAMILSEAQIARMAKLGSRVTMQPEFLIRFGHAYQRQLGPERASQIKRMRSVYDAGLRLSLSSDRPIVAGNPWDGIWPAVERPTGFDPAESLTLQEAFDGYTIMGAEANDDLATQGSLEPGKWADFQLYEKNPFEHRNQAPVQTRVGAGSE